MFQESLPVIDTQVTAEVLSDLEHSSQSITTHHDKIMLETSYHSYYLCEYCPFMCLTEKVLTDHVNLIHQLKKSSQVYEIQCPGCPNIFNHKPSLESHLTYDHCLGNREDREKILQIVLEAKKSTSYIKRDPLIHIESVQTIETVEQLETTDRRIEIENRKDATILIFNADAGHHAEKLLESANEVNALTNIRIVNDPVTNELSFIEESDCNHQFDRNNSQEEHTATSMDDSIEIEIVNDSTEGEGGESNIRVVNPNSNTIVNIDMNNTSIVNQSIPSIVPTIHYVSDKKLHKCSNEQCRLKMQDYDKMQYHIKCHAEGKFVCPETDCKGKESSPHWKTMSGHLWRVHKLDMELLKCDMCDYRTHSYSKLHNTHRLIHGDDKHFQCDKCSKMFKNAKQLRNHRDHSHKDANASTSTTTKTRSFPCVECDKMFAKRRQLKVHMDTVHKKIKPHICSFCAFTSSTKGGLKMHVRLHTGEKPFKCDICNYSTADHNSLRRHKLRHTGEKPYKCNHCDYECIQSSTYKMHIKTKHPGLDKKLLFSCPICHFRSVSVVVFAAHMHAHRKHSTFAKNNTESSTSSIAATTPTIVIMPSKAKATEREKHSVAELDLEDEHEEEETDAT